MPYFEDDRAVYGHIGYLLRAATADEALSARLRDADAVVQYDVRRPDARITAALRSEGDLRVDLGRTELRPDVVLTMDGDTAHAYWQGQVNLSVALAKGQIKAFGPVAAILRLVPLSQALFPRYRDLVEGGDIPSLDASVGATAGNGAERAAEAGAESEAPAGEPPAEQATEEGASAEAEPAAEAPAEPPTEATAEEPAAAGAGRARSRPRRSRPRPRRRSRPRRSRPRRSRPRPTWRSPSSRRSRHPPGPSRPRTSRPRRSRLRPTWRSPSSRRSRRPPSPRRPASRPPTSPRRGRADAARRRAERQG